MFTIMYHNVGSPHAMIIMFVAKSTTVTLTEFKILGVCLLYQQMNLTSYHLQMGEENATTTTITQARLDTINFHLAHHL